MPLIDRVATRQRQRESLSEPLDDSGHPFILDSHHLRMTRRRQKDESSLPFIFLPSVPLRAISAFRDLHIRHGMAQGFAPTLLPKQAGSATRIGHPYAAHAPLFTSRCTLRILTCLAPRKPSTLAVASQALPEEQSLQSVGTSRLRSRSRTIAAGRSRRSSRSAAVSPRLPSGIRWCFCAPASRHSANW